MLIIFSFRLTRKRGVLVYKETVFNNIKKVFHPTNFHMQIDRLIIDFLIILCHNYSIVVLLFVLIKPIVQIVLETLV